MKAREHWVREAVKSVVTCRLPQKPSRCGVEGVCEGGFDMVTSALGGGRQQSKRLLCETWCFSRGCEKSWIPEALGAVINLPGCVISLYFNGSWRLSTGNSFIGVNQRTYTCERRWMGRIPLIFSHPRCLKSMEKWLWGLQCPHIFTHASLPVALI